MIKKTLYFGNPTYLSCQLNQLVIKLPEVEKNKEYPAMLKDASVRKIPIEDIGVVILDHSQITVTQSTLCALLNNNVAFVTCNERHMPQGLLLNLDGHTLQSQRYKHQIEASEPLKKQLWQQTVEAKLSNQSMVLKLRGHKHNDLEQMAAHVKSGDSENHEARGAAIYWSRIFSHVLPTFTRGREEGGANQLLNYGYAILRAVIARSLVGSGLLPTLGIFHRNQYNAYCLADDVMEPFRPFVDLKVLEIIEKEPDFNTVTPEHKKQLLTVPGLDCLLNKERSPLMVASSRTTASLMGCFEGNRRKIAYPSFAES